MKLRIRNFQSAEDCEIEIPEKSFTCLVGPTNIGKSAVRRALECVLYNKSEVSYIRNGAAQCEVELTLGDGTHIKWSRDKKTAVYEINGEKFSKLNGTVPDILLKKGFRELSLSKEKLAVQVAHQFQNIFLLNQPGGKVTEVLSNLGNLHRIIEANKACLSDKKEIKSKLKVRYEDNDFAKQKLGSFVGLEDQKVRVDELKALLNDLKNIQANKDKASKLQTKLQKSMLTVSQLRKLKDVQAPEFDISLDQFKALTSLRNKYEILSSKVLKYKNLEDIKEVSYELDDDLAKFAKVKKLYENLIAREKKVASYKGIPEEVPVVEINPGDLATVKKLYDKLEITKKNVLSYRSKVKESEENLKDLETKFHDLKHELGVCPLCDSSLR